MYVEYIEGQKFSSKNPNYSESMDSFDTCGYVLNDDEFVVDIDCLNKEQIQSLIDMFDIKTQIVWTDRGVHLYYQMPIGMRRAKVTTPLGFKVEFKTPKNTGDVTIKKNGVARKIENEGKREVLPNIFDYHKRWKDLTNVQEGNRNNTLFEHANRIAKFPEHKKMLMWINQNLFDPPLSNQEFESCCREREGVVGEKDAEIETALAIIEKHKVVKYLADCYYLQDGEYISDEDVIDRLIVQFCPTQKSRYIDEVKKQIRMRCKLIPKGTEFKVKFVNGYLHNGKFIEGVDSSFTPYSVPIYYDPDKEPVQAVVDYLNQFCDGDEDYIDRILEILAHCFITNKSFKRKLARYFIFYGDGQNGKGTLLEVISHILGFKNTSALSISQLGDERYSWNLIGKLANLGDDLEDAPINNKQMKMLKNLSTCDMVEFRKMRENSVTERLTISLIFTSNHILKSFEKNVAVNRRIDWLPIMTKPKVVDSEMIDKLTTKDALEYWIKLIVEAYFRLYENGDFTSCDKVAKFKKEYIRENDNSIEYIESLDDNDIDGIRVKQLRLNYEKWCEDNDFKPIGSKTFGANLLNLRGFKSRPERIMEGEGEYVTKTVVRVYHKVDGWKISPMVEELMKRDPEDSTYL